MNPKLRISLFILGLLTLLGIGILFIPRALGLYYQIKGGQLLQDVLKSLEDLPDLGLTCDALPPDRKALRMKLEQAVIKLNKAHNYDDRNSQAYLYLGHSACLLGEPANAKGYYLTYTQLRPANPLGYLGLGFAEEALGDHLSAVKEWQAAGLTAEDFLEAGDEAYQANRYEQALSWYKRSSWIAPTRATAWFNLGQVYEQLGQPESALEAYQEAWKFDPELSTMFLVTSLKRRGDFKEMENVLREALGIVPESGERLGWWRALGDALRLQEQWDAAVEVYQDAIQQFPNEPDLYISLGWIYYDRGDGARPAQREFNRAINLKKDAPEGYFALAQLFSREKQFQEADGYFLRALERAPNNRWYYLARGDNARLASDFNRAQEIYEKTIARFPNFHNAYYQLALIYRSLGRYDDAVGAIERAVELMDPPVDSYFARAGEIYRGAGLREKAVKAYRQALILNPDNKVAQKGLQLLGEN